jgi:transposase
LIYTWRRKLLDTGGAQEASAHEALPAPVFVEAVMDGDPAAAASCAEHPAMIPSGARVWIALGHTDMREGMQGLALLVQQGLKRNPHGGDLFVFRGRAGSLIKIIWHHGIGMSLYAKRLEKGRFVWPSAKEGTVSLTLSQLACLLEGIDWRNPQYTWRPASAR